MVIFAHFFVRENYSASPSNPTSSPTLIDRAVGPRSDRGQTDRGQTAVRQTAVGPRSDSAVKIDRIF